MSEVKINPEGKVVFISGSNRGIGKALTVEFLESGAKKVYAGARDTSALSSLVEKYGDRIIPIQLDVTDDESIAKAASSATDVEILVNNAGILAPGGFTTPGALEGLMTHLSVNVFGLVKLTSALIGSIKDKESGAIVNISSVAGLGSMPMLGTYSASKATVHSITQSIRGELANDNILVTGVYPGPIDTDMAKGFEMEKDSPEVVATNVVKGLKDGLEDIYPDSMSEQVGAGYAANPKAIEKDFAAYVG